VFVRGVVKEGRLFFFEKRTKKLLFLRSFNLRNGAFEEIKVFCFFSSEKKALLISVAASVGFHR
jgi:hypothetical protein